MWWAVGCPACVPTPVRGLLLRILLMLSEYYTMYCLVVSSTYTVVAFLRVALCWVTCVSALLSLGCVYLAAAGKIWPMGCHTYVLRTVLVVLSLLVGRSAWALCFVLCASLVSTYVPTGVLDTSLTPG